MNILIASHSRERSAWQPVADDLQKQGYETIIYQADQVYSGAVALDINMNPQTGLTIRYDQQPLHLAELGAAWFRHASHFDPPIADAGLKLSLQIQCALAQQGLWQTIPEHTWLNPPERIHRAEDKISQLITATEVGFTIPSETVVANNWQSVHERLPNDIIYKPFYPMMYRNNKPMLVYTRRLENPSDLPPEKNPFPGIYQPYLPKAREWRITVVGDETFDTAIYTKGAAAKEDWRAHQSTSNVRFAKEEFPLAEKERCFRYLGTYGLRFGCFDFIEGQDGAITFLECNPNGQYGWLQAELGLPISGAISSELARIARANHAGP